MIDLLLVLVLLLSLVAVAWPFFFYPLILRLLPTRAEAPADGPLPSASLLFCAYNEAASMPDKLANLAMLKARLYEAEMRSREEAASAEHASKSDIGWGHQIRSYVLQPYQMVKDLRTGVVSTSPDAVLDGAIDPFISAALAQRVTGETVEIEDVE